MSESVSLMDMVGHVGGWQGLHRLFEAWKSYEPGAGGFRPHVAVCV
jgi:hypothetical protein